jgi:hypothetical protein
MVCFFVLGCCDVVSFIVCCLLQFFWFDILITLQAKVVAMEKDMASGLALAMEKDPGSQGPLPGQCYNSIAS